MVFLLSVFVPYAVMGFYLSGCAKPRGSLDPGLVKIKVFVGICKKCVLLS